MSREVASHGVTRRHFVGGLGAAGATLGAPALLVACGGGDPGGGTPDAGAGRERRTLFFNFAHLGPAPTTHCLYACGRRHVLTRVADQPQVLRQARIGNEFLRAVPDAHITHHVEGVEFPTDVVTLAYLTCNESPDSGTWEMTSMYFNIPSTAAVQGYARARARTPAGVLPLSNKRRAYGVRAAASERDLRDEHALIDCTSHADALVGLHPDILSIEPGSAAFIQASYVGVDSNTQFLGELLRSMGPAVPQGMANVAGKPSWATLLPLMNPSTHPPMPYKKRDGKLNQYYPDWSPRVDEGMASALGAVHPLVRNDASLGADVTGFTQANPMPPSQALGKVWSRHDGSASVNHPPSAAQAGAPVCTFRNQGAETGLSVSDPGTIVSLGDGRVQVTVDNVANWFLRWLGMWVQFLDPNGTVIAASSLPPDTLPALTKPNPLGLDKPDALFVGVLGQPTAIFGIPVYPGTFSPVVTIPASAQTLRILYAGLGQSGSIPDDPAHIIAVGIGMTVAIDYGLVGLFMAAGVSTYEQIIKEVVAIGGGLVAGELVAVLGADILDGGTRAPLLATAMKFMQVLLQRGLMPGLVRLATAIVEALAEAEWIDSIPVAGQIARAVAAAVGGLQLAETSLEVAISPAVYRFDLALTHDLGVTVLPDAGNTQFPQLPSGYTLYYKVTYLFDEGKAHVQDAVDVPATARSIDIVLRGIPRGGRVNIEVGLYARHSSTPAEQNDWCAGYGSTGLFDNTVDQAPSITITQTRIPIQADTRYGHVRKTALDANGRHVWTDTATAPPYTPPPGGQQPGLGGFRGITVRQATSQPAQAGYVGYAWQAFSSDINGCQASAPGQLDQLANLNTDASDGGVHAQDGYASTLCGLQAGVRIAYDLLGGPAQNYYLDTDKMQVRQVQLADPPAFADPNGGKSFGMLNLDSRQLLLHPAGHLVSISNESHKLETLQLPATPMSDGDAQRKLRARTHSGLGTQPGLMTSPLAAAISPDGVILVLEGGAGNERIQAFDLGGNAVPYFKQQARPYFLPLTATAGAQYLDLAVEFTGYVYVLSRDAAGNHRLDIYHPGQSGSQPICTTQGVTAARLAVDLWRSVYTLNYELLRLPGGAVPGVSEPSVSLWVPPPPS